MAMVFIFACLISLPYMVGAAGGLSDLIASAKAQIPYAFTWTGKMSVSKAIWFYIEMNLVSLMLGLASPHLLSRVFLTEDEKTLTRSMILVPFVYAVWLLGFFFIMGLLPVLNPSIAKSSEIFPWVAKNIVPPLVGAIALSGVVAAAFSTTSTMLQQAGAALSRDIYQKHINPNASPERLLLLARLSIIIIIGIVFIGAAFQKLTSFAMVYAFFFASSVWTAWGAALYGGILYKKATASAALWSMVIGGGLCLVIGFLRTIKHYPFGPIPPVLAGIIVSTVIFFVISAMTTPKPETLAYYENMEKLAGSTGVESK
jgi:Na+/proline symporter